MVTRRILTDPTYKQKSYLQYSWIFHTTKELTHFAAFLLHLPEITARASTVFEMVVAIDISDDNFPQGNL